MQPIVPGFTITDELSSDATGSTWAAIRALDGRQLALRPIAVPDLTQAQAQSDQLITLLALVRNEHLVRHHGAIALADGSLALVLDRVTGDSLGRLLSDRVHLTPGETITAVAPMFGVLADLHAAGVVHGDLGPSSVVFNVDGRPLIGDFAVARLQGRTSVHVDRAGSFAAPEVVGGSAPSPASDVYSMAALGWLCVTGTPPDLVSTPSSMPALSPRIPAALADVLTSCLSADPTARPTARQAAIAVFDSGPAESVILMSAADPANEITRRIRAGAAVPSTPEVAETRKGYKPWLVVGVAVLLVAVVFGIGVTRFARSPQVADQPLAARSAAPTASPTTTAHPKPPVTTPVKVAPTRPSRSSNEVVTARSSPRVASAALLQALVDARALAYLARSSALLDLVYAPGATGADTDRANIATALKNGGTYLGLSYVIQDVEFIDDTTGTARIRATILTPAYNTGQPDGRKILHRQEILRRCIFSLELTPEGWRVLGLRVPQS